MIAGSKVSEIDVFVDQLHRNFKITMCTLSNFLGMQIEHREERNFMCQSVYMKKVLERFKMHEENPVATPCERSSGGTEDSGGSNAAYRKAVCCLMYLMTGTRPDITLPCREQLEQWIDQQRQSGLVSNISSRERANMVCCTELVTLRDLKSIQLCQLCI